MASFWAPGPAGSLFPPLVLPPRTPVPAGEVLPFRPLGAAQVRTIPAWRVTVYRAVRALAFPLVVGLPPLFWVVEASYRASLTTLGRDQGIFQYVAWAIQKGAVDYRDVRDVNGPLTHLVHLIFLALGGRDEHQFRVLDMIVTGAAFALTAACLPGIGRSGKVRAIERIGWAFAGWVILTGQHLLYLYWDLAQRETFFDWFMLSAVALQLYAERELRNPVGKHALFVLALAGALGVIPWFGKPTYVIFSAVQVAALLLNDQATISRKKRLSTLVLGGAVGALTQVAFLLWRGDIRAFLKIYLVDVPAMYRFMLPRSPAEILSLTWGGPMSAIAFGTSLLLLALIWDGQMPRRALGVALLPLGGIVSVLAQAKGFPYHFHPVTAGLHLQWLLLVVWLWERYQFAPRKAIFPRALPFVAAAALTLKVAVSMTTSPHILDLWILDKGANAETRGTRDYLVYFEDKDFFPWEMRQTAEYLREHTTPNDRVQIYGMDPYVLFLAERLSATPYIYVYDLNADAALGGSWLPEGLHPNGEQSTKIRALRSEHVDDLYARVKKAPPAAFVFFDKSPLISFEDAWIDFAEHSPEAAAWVHEHYKETAAFAADHIWMRNDLAEKIATSKVP